MCSGPARGGGEGGENPGPGTFGGPAKPGPPGPRIPNHADRQVPRRGLAKPGPMRRGPNAHLSFLESFR